MHFNFCCKRHKPIDEQKQPFEALKNAFYLCLEKCILILIKDNLSKHAACLRNLQLATIPEEFRAALLPNLENDRTPIGIFHLFRFPFYFLYFFFFSRANKYSAAGPELEKN